MKIQNRKRSKYYIATAILILILFMNIALGSIIIPFKEIISSLFGANAQDYINEIIWNYRIPKAFTAILAGMSLSVCGLQMQTLFKNPLADPYILGISSGAGFGVALLVLGLSAFGISTDGSILSNIGVATAGWLGATGITALILLVSSKLKDNLSLLIFGIMLGSAVTAIISLLQYFSSAQALKVFVLWTMGSFAGLGQGELLILTTLVICGMIISVYNIKELNVLLMGENYAKSLGVNLEKTRRRILIATTLLAGGVTAFCGPIGFIGIAVPHISRMIFKDANHKILLPATALTGSIIMLVTDTIAQLPGQSQVLPVNTVSAMIGIPVILIIILKSKLS